MTVRRLSISVSPEVEEAIRNAAERADLSVSAWLARAAEHVAKLEDGLAAMAEWQAEHGAFTPDERRQARQALIEDGVIEPEDLKEAC